MVPSCHLVKELLLGRRLGVLFAALWVGMCGPAALPAFGQEDGARQQGATLRIGQPQQIDSLNPFIGFSLAATDIFRAIYPTLTTYGPQDFAVQPELAESWESSPDKLTWTFKIRPGVRWSDGRPVTARDAAYTYNRMMTDPAASTAQGNYVENFEAVTAPDERTLVIKTKSPQSTMLAIDVPIVPEHIWSKIGDIASFPNDRMPVVGSGPFVLTGYEPEQDVTLRANEHYWRGSPEIDELQFRSFKNSDAEVQALIKGEIDVARKLTPTQFDALEGQRNIKRVNGQGRRFYELILNPGATNSDNAPIGTGHPALRDVRVRQAIDRAINRDALVDRVLGGHGQLGSGYLPPIFDDYHWSPPEQQRRDFDIPAANRALDAAGYPRGEDGTRRTPQGEPLNFEFVLHGSESSDSQVGEFVKRWLSEIGVNVELQPVSDNQVNERTTGGDFDLVASGWSANPDPDYVLGLQTCAARPSPAGGGTPDSFLCDPRYDDLYARQLAEFDPAARADLVGQAQQRFHEQATGLILYYENSLEAYRSDHFAGFTTQPREQGVITGQQGFWGYFGARPTAEASDKPERADYERAALVIVGVVVLAGVAVSLVVGYRRSTRDRRE